MSVRTPIRGMAASTIDAYAELFAQDPGAFTDSEEDTDLVILLQSWDGRALTVTDANREAVGRALTDLANGEDEIAEEERRKPLDNGTTSRRGSRDTERMRHARAASDGLSWVRT